MSPFDIQSLADIQLLRESVDLECKLARGRDGQGALPDDFWPTYSAFANTGGGVVVLGLRERNDGFEVEGIANVAKVRKELFDGLNNRQKVSINLLSDADVTELALPEGTLLVICIPRANRKQRPVFLRGNPMGHTYLRLNEGDRTVANEDVKRMLAEQVEDSRDSRILRGYGLSDLCMETFRAYRQVFANREPAHPWNALDDLDFLRQIGGWRQDREIGESGLTLAGVLMFGWMSTLQETLPNYMLDYQERPEARIERRWVDRITLDGKWSGNLYDFYRKVYLKLTADLKVPFSLEKGERQDETPVHVALREALANVLVHADYSERASVLVVKRPDMFGFRNPGLMRIPRDIAIHGGEHDCRNRTLHKMFRLVGVGEQAGSGIPKIYDGWAGQHWRAPALYERMEPYNQTLLELRMVDLLPEDLLAGLRKTFGAGFDALQRNERLTLAAAASEKTVTHARVIEMTGLHPVDATRLLQSLVKEGFLESHNPGRGAVYCLPGAALPRPEEVFGEGSAVVPNRSAHLGSGSGHLPGRSGHLPAGSGHLQPAEPGQAIENQRDEAGRLISRQLDAPVLNALEQLAPAFRTALEGMAASPRSRKKIPKAAMEDVIVALCAGHYITGTCIATLVDRDPDALRKHYLRPLVQAGRLRFAFPTAPTHAMQAYRATQP
ncbi:AAA family ATPase [Stenotrophomonas maltophilia]|uniref:RNA-binding domain-containing protein n=1 Tax=Stenotrophomonas maltophilia TaxID=40324 RepID=UPI000DA9C010|nr:RNA-binding domain-containing protein [Stenotrophomonas maltophilia]PZS71054.1 AAA family ATPase [Stenotrophomonas maltophilia]